MALDISATDVELPNTVNNVFISTFLRRAQQVAPYFLGTQPATLITQAGTNVVKWRRINQLTPTTTPLAELVTTASYMNGRNSVLAQTQDIVAPVAKYGQFYIVSEEVDLYNPNGTTDNLVGTLAESAGRSLNQLQRDIAEDNSTQRFANNVANTAAVASKLLPGDLDRVINELARAAAIPFSPMTTGSTDIGTAPILRSFWAINHPDVAYDVSRMTGFKSVETYAGQTATVPGEYGYYSSGGFGIRFVQTPDASIDADAGAVGGTDLRGTTPTDTDVYTTVVYGMNAFGSVGLGRQHTDGVYRAGDNTGGWDLIFHPRGSAGAADPLNEIGTLGWKAFHGGAVIDLSWSRAIRSGSTNLSN